MLNFLFINTPLKFLVQSFWRDEAFSYLVAKRGILDILTITARDSSPPLHYILLHFWILVFGSSEIAQRSLSLVFFFGTLYVFILFLQNIFKLDQKSVALYSLLFVLNPFLNYFAFESRMYTLFAFLGTLSFYFFAKKNFKGYFISTLLGFFTHYFMALAVISQFVISFFIFDKKTRVKFFKNLGVILLLFAPWAIYFLANKPDLSQNWIISAPLSLIWHIPPIYSGFEVQEEISKNFLQPEHALLPTLLVIFFVSLLNIIKSGKEDLKKLILLSFWAFLPPLIIFTVSLYHPLFLPRYFIPSTVGILLLLSYLLSRLSLTQRLPLITLLILITVNYNNQQIAFRIKDDIRKPVTEIKRIASKGDLLYVTSELNFHTSQYYFGEDRVFIYNKSYEEIPWYVGKILIPKKKVVNKIPPYPRKTFVLNDDLSYEIKTSL